MQTHTATAFSQSISAYKNAHDTTGVTVSLNAAIKVLKLKHTGSAALHRTEQCYANLS